METQKRLPLLGCGQEPKNNSLVCNSPHCVLVIGNSTFKTEVRKNKDGSVVVRTHNSFNRANIELKCGQLCPVCQNCELVCQSGCQ